MTPARLARRARLAATVLAAGGLVVLAACSADPGDFSDDAEDFINDSDELPDAVGVGFSDADCESPDRVADDETFSCVATADDGTPWRFTATITSDDHYLITQAVPITAPATTAPVPTSTPAG